MSQWYMKLHIYRTFFWSSLYARRSDGQAPVGGRPSTGTVTHVFYEVSLAYDDFESQM